MDEELRKKEDEDDKQDSDFDPELEEMLEQSRKTQAPLVREIETSLLRKYSAENCWCIRSHSRVCTFSAMHTSAIAGAHF